MSEDREDIIDPVPEPEEGDGRESSTPETPAPSKKGKFFWPVMCGMSALLAAALVFGMSQCSRADRAEEQNDGALNRINQNTEQIISIADSTKRDVRDVRGTVGAIRDTLEIVHEDVRDVHADTDTIKQLVRQNGEKLDSIRDCACGGQNNSGQRPPRPNPQPQPQPPVRDTVVVYVSDDKPVQNNTVINIDDGSSNNGNITVINGDVHYYGNRAPADTVRVPANKSYGASTVIIRKVKTYRRVR